MIFDTHTHYDDEAFDDDREKILGSLKENQIERIVNVGADIASSKMTIALTEEYSFLYGAVGVHPSETKELTDQDMNWIRESSKLPKIVAIGEIGLDYYWGEPEKEIQKKWFREQLKIAREESLGEFTSYYYSQPRSCTGYIRDYETRTCRENRWGYSLFFLFYRDGKGIYTDGILYRNRWSGHF